MKLFYIIYLMILLSFYVWGKNHVDHGMTLEKFRLKCKSAIHVSISDSDVTYLDRLIDGGCDLNRLVIRGQSPLGWAVKRFHISWEPYEKRIGIIRSLVKGGANPCMLNAKGMNPYSEYYRILWFFEWPNKEVKLLLDVCNSNNFVDAPEYAHCKDARLKDARIKIGFDNYWKCTGWKQAPSI
jgi:hypothetical protein